MAAFTLFCRATSPNSVIILMPRSILPQWLLASSSTKRSSNIFAVTLLFSIHNYRRMMRRRQPPKTQSPSPKALVIQHQIACPRRLCRCRRGPVQSPGACPPRMTPHSIARCDEQRMNGFAGGGWGTPVALRPPAASDRSVSKSGHRPRQGNLDW